MGSHKFGTIPKQAVLYLHAKAHGQYRCQACPMWVRDTERCTIHGKNDVIRAHGSCGYWVPGAPITSEEDEPHGMVTKQQSGYLENDPGFSCKRCVFFRKQDSDCYKVDKDSPGDDPGEIHPDACCNHWSG